MKTKILYAVPIGLMLILAFLFGFLVPDVSASHGDADELRAQLHMLPSRLAMLADNPSEKGDSELPILQTYSQVLSQLKDDYYGQKVDDRQLTYSAIRGMIRALNDPFTRFLDPDTYKNEREKYAGDFVGIGAQLQVNKKQQVYIVEPLPDSPAMAAGVKAGDVILRVNGKMIAGQDIDKVVQQIRGPEGTKVKLSLLRGTQKKPIEMTIVRRMLEYREVRSKMLDTTNGIGYIRLYDFFEHSDSQFEAGMNDLEKHNLKGLVFDLRGNTGGLLQVAVAIGSRFVENGPIVVIQERNGSKDSLNVDTSKHNHKRYPLVVLVNRDSASASEIVSGAIQDNKAGTLVGTRTFGKARVQTMSALLDGSAIAITTAKYLTPAGRDINKVGVQPDVKIDAPATMEIGDPKKDVQLAKAIELMKAKLNIPTGRPALASEPVPAASGKR